MHCLPATSHAANENPFRCFASCTGSKKDSYGMRKRLRNFQYSLESRFFSSGFLRITYHLEKSDRRGTCRVRLTSDRGWNRHPRFLLSPPSPCSIARPLSEPTRPRSWLGAVSANELREGKNNAQLSSIQICDGEKVHIIIIAVVIRNTLPDLF